MIRVQSLLEKDIMSSERVLHAGEIFPMHCHDYIEFEFILSGKGEHIYNSEVFELDAGHAFIVTHRDLHAIRAITDMNVINIGFDVNFIDASVSEILQYDANKKLYCILSKKDTEYLYGICKRLLHELENRDKFSDILLKSLLSEILVETVRRSLTGETEPPSLCQRALEYIHSNFKGELSLTKTADLLSVTPNYLGRIFRRDMGVPFNTYLNTIRMRYACSLLLFSDITAKEIAEMSGYLSQEYFYSVFKKRFGITPTEYRAENASSLTHSHINTTSILI